MTKKKVLLEVVSKTFTLPWPRFGDSIMYYRVPIVTLWKTLYPTITNSQHSQSEISSFFDPQAGWGGSTGARKGGARLTLGATREREREKEREDTKAGRT